jgi:hypothetical protein
VNTIAHSITTDELIARYRQDPVLIAFEEEDELYRRLGGRFRHSERDNADLCVNDLHTLIEKHEARLSAADWRYRTMTRRVDPNYTRVRTIGGVLRRGPIVGYRVLSDWTVGDRTVTLALGQATAAGPVRSWLRPDHVLVETFAERDAALAAAAGAEDYLSLARRPVRVEPVYGEFERARCRGGIGL